jgi:hypothetical protein
LYRACTDFETKAKTMASDYHRGEMDIQEQASTYDAFMGLTKWGSLAIAVSLLMATLWFCTPAGFVGGLVPGLVLAVAGFFLLRDKKNGGH